MAKGWTHFGTINELIQPERTREEKYHIAHKFDTAIRSMKTPSSFDLLNEGKAFEIYTQRMNDFIEKKNKAGMPSYKKVLKEVQKNAIPKDKKK